LSHLVEFCKQLWWSTTCKTRYEMELDASRRVRRGCYLESQVLRGRPVSPLKGFCCAPESQLLHSLNFQFSLFRIHFIVQSECPFRVPLHQFQNLIHRQCHHTEHQVRHHFGRTAHPYVPPSKLVLQSRVDPLHHGSLLVSVLLGPSQFPLPLAHRDRFGLTLRSARGFRIHDGHVPQVAALLCNVMRIVGRVHQFIAIGDTLRTHRGQGNGHLKILVRGPRRAGLGGALTPFFGVGGTPAPPFFWGGGAPPLSPTE